MSTPNTGIAFTSAVKAIQSRLGSRSTYEQWERQRGFRTHVTSELAGFVADRDSFYIATASAEGRPYVQHRGGKRGFLKVVDERTLAFADFSGNRQYISMGNLSENSQAHLFLMDYRNQKRIKIWGTARYVEGDAELLEQVADRDYAGLPERVLVFEIEAWDTNCPQHIPRLYSQDEVDSREQDLRDRILELEGLRQDP